MKRQLIAVFLVLGAGCAARAQEAVPDTQAVNRNVAAEFSASPAADTNSFQPAAASALSPAARFAPLLASLSLPGNAAPEPSPLPAPDPKFIYGGRDDFRWQLAIGADWLRFRSSIFNASAVGVNASVTYFTNEWFGIEGSASTGFAPEIFNKEHVKLLVYGAGPKIAWRERKWEPWLHLIVGGSHEQPQTAGNSKNSYAIEAGGGADYRFNPRFSGRLEGDWVRTGFFSQSQNNFQLMGGVVFHF
jgi:opacity protein-like surface antigen